MGYDHIENKERWAVKATKARMESATDVSLAMHSIDVVVETLKRAQQRTPSASLEWAINSLEGTVAGPLIDALRELKE